MDQAAVDQAIKAAFVEYDDKATARLNQLVDEAYTRAKADTVVQLRSENETTLAAIKSSADEKLVSIDATLKGVIDALNAQQKILDDKFEHLNAELARHQTEVTARQAEAAEFRRVGENLASSSEGLRSLDVTVRDYMNTQHVKLTEQFATCQGQLNTIINEAKSDMADLAVGTGGDSGGHGGHEGGARGRGLVDPKEIKIDKMGTSMNLEEFRKWKHDVMKFVDSIPKWQRGGRLLEEVRISPVEIDATVYEVMIRKINSEHASAGNPGVAIDGFKWLFADRTEEFYNFI